MKKIVSFLTIAATLIMTVGMLTGCGKHYEAVEITMDNWQDYFEPIEVVFNYYDAFGDVTMSQIEMFYALKDTYEIDESESDFAIKLKYHTEKHYVTLNEDGTFVKEELMANTKNNPEDQFELTKEARWNKVADDEEGSSRGIGYYGVEYNTRGDSSDVFTDSDTGRNYAQFSIVDEVEKVKGTIYICEKDKF